MAAFPLVVNPLDHAAETGAGCEAVAGACGAGAGSGGRGWAGPRAGGEAADAVAIGMGEVPGDVGAGDEDDVGPAVEDVAAVADADGLDVVEGPGAAGAVTVLLPVADGDVGKGAAEGEVWFGAGAGTGDELAVAAGAGAGGGAEADADGLGVEEGTGAAGAVAVLLAVADGEVGRGAADGEVGFGAVAGTDDELAVAAGAGARGGAVADPDGLGVEEGTGADAAVVVGGVGGGVGGDATGGELGAGFAVWAGGSDRSVLLELAAGALGGDCSMTTRISPGRSGGITTSTPRRSAGIPTCGVSLSLGDRAGVVTVGSLVGLAVDVGQLVGVGACGAAGPSSLGRAVGVRPGEVWVGSWGAPGGAVQTGSPSGALGSCPPGRDGSPVTVTAAPCRSSSRGPSVGVLRGIGSVHADPAPGRLVEVVAGCSSPPHAVGVRPEVVWAGSWGAPGGAVQTGSPCGVLGSCPSGRDGSPVTVTAAPCRLSSRGPSVGVLRGIGSVHADPAPGRLVGVGDCGVVGPSSLGRAVGVRPGEVWVGSWGAPGGAVQTDSPCGVLGSCPPGRDGSPVTPAPCRSSSRGARAVSESAYACDSREAGGAVQVRLVCQEDLGSSSGFGGAVGAAFVRGGRVCSAWL